MRRGETADWRGELVRDLGRDPNISSNEGGVEPGSSARPEFSVGKQPRGALQRVVRGTPRACLCKSRWAGNYSCLSEAGSGAGEFMII